jgi:penicillin-binding protein 1A
MPIRRRKKIKHNKPWAKVPRWLPKAGLFAALAAVLAIVLLWLLVRFGLFGEIPSINDLKAIKNHNSSEVYSSDGVLLGKYYILDRTSILLDDIPVHTIDALIATEDIRFFRHRGTDYRSLGRVLVKNLLMGQRSAGGGSTITRQLAKNLYPRSAKGLVGLAGEKIREGTIARRLEKAYNKEEILALYLNTVHFGENVFGISAAAQRFFNKSATELQPEEAAVLVGMLKAGTTYNPRLFPERSLSRRNTVIGQLEKYEFITAETADSLRALPLHFNYTPLTHADGPAPYFRERLRLELMRWLEEYNATHGTTYNLYTDGLRIHTTIDAALQELAEESLQNQLHTLQARADQHYRLATPERVSALLDQLGSKPGSDRDSIFQAQKQVHGALVSIEPGTGYVRAWIGGKDIRRFQFDNVVSRRQAGSSFKPFVYAAALESGARPCEYMPNDSLVLAEYGNWSPRNADGNYEGYYSMAGALARSVNTISVRYLLQTGFAPVVSLASRAGMQGPFPRVPSLALGATEVSLLELTAAYSIFPNAGVPVTPRWLLRIEDAEGNLLLTAPGPSPLPACLTQDNARLMNEILQGVTRYGTAAQAGGRLGTRMDAAGKTGTTQHNSDSWFIGYTPGLITGVWTGVENPAFARTYPFPFGSAAAAVPVWTAFMDQAHQLPATRHYASGRFDPLPEHLVTLLDCPHYLEEIQRESLLDRIFRRDPDRRGVERDDSLAPRRRSLIRRIIEELF